jgi:excinuclease ABC subunit C
MKTNHLPDTPGIYIFKKGKKILYIGKATNLKDRVRSYFARDILMTRSPLIAKMLEEANKIDFIQTDSVLEALILEASEIKKYQPVYNSKEKDDKSYNYVVITKEEFPKVLVARAGELKVGPWESVFKVRPWNTYGPFPYGAELKEALKIIRKILHFRDDKCKLSGKPCFNAQIGLCPGPCAGWISKKDYKKNISHIKLFLEAKKPRLVKHLEREMKALARKHQFEEANKIKKQIFALDHIQDIALIKRDLGFKIHDLGMRIEAYDVAHISGKDVVGVMTVVEDGELNKSQYRKFKIRDDKNDDTKNLQEILTRRLNHLEWRMPDLIVVDGGIGQLNATRAITKIPVIAVTKDEHHRAKEIIPKSRILNLESRRAILLANAEAHRFAIGYHRKLRSKGFRL